MFSPPPYCHLLDDGNRSPRTGTSTATGDEDGAQPPARQVSVSEAICTVGRSALQTTRFSSLVLIPQSSFAVICWRSVPSLQEPQQQ